MLSGKSRKVLFGLLVLLLVASIPSVRLIPFYSTWGLDLQNLFRFQHCAGGNNPYLTTGLACGDPSARDMFYPPLLYWSFLWLRLCTLRVAVVVWSAAIVFIMVPLGRLWAGRTSGMWVFWLLLLAQYPVVFAVERGNSDVLVVGLWSLALAMQRRPFVQGTLFALSVALKLYPAFALVVVGVGLLTETVQQRSVRRLAWTGAGSIIGAALAAALFWQQTLTYIHVQLPRISHSAPLLVPYGHAVPALGPRIATVLGAMLLAVWSLAAFRRWRRDPTLIFAGALAITTYFASVSFDYNLLTVYPLLAVLYARAVGLGAWPPMVLLFLGLIMIVADRGLFSTPTMIRVHTGGQVAWLLLTGLWVITLPNAEEGQA